MSYAFASAWTLAKDERFSISEFTYKSMKITGNDFYFNEREKIFNQNIEYGIRDDLTSGITLLHINNKSITANNLLFERQLLDKSIKRYTSFYLRQRLFIKDNIVFSMQPLINHHSMEIAALIGYSYKNTKNLQKFYSFEIAHRNNKLNANQLLASFTFGSYLSDSLLIMHQLFIEYITAKYFANQYVTYPLTTINDGVTATIKNVFAYRTKYQQKISVVKNLNSKYSLAFALSNYFGDKNFLGKGMSIALWINL